MGLERCRGWPIFWALELRECSHITNQSWYLEVKELFEGTASDDLLYRGR